MKQQDSSVWERQMKMSGWSQNRGRSIGYNQPLGLPQSSWPSLQMQNQYTQSQQHASSGNRAVFLGDSQVKKKKCTGTGVFLPRRYGDQPDSRRKAGTKSHHLSSLFYHLCDINLLSRLILLLLFHRFPCSSSTKGGSSSELEFQ